MKNRKKAGILICVFFIVYAYAVKQITDYDYWFHYACGEWIAENGTIPETAIWSWYGIENGLEWISHEWLFGLFIYGFVSLFGENALSIFCPAMVAAAVTAAFAYGIDKWEDHPLLVLALSVFAGYAMAPVSAPRPQLFMYLLVLALTVLLLNERKKPSNRLWLTVPLTVLWVNVHGGSYILVFVYLGLLIILDAFSFRFGEITTEKVPFAVTKKRLCVFAVSLASVMLNGHGYKMYLYPITNMSDSVMINSITEWQPINLNSIGEIEIAVLVFIAVFAVMFLANRKCDIFSFLVTGSWIFLSFKSIRFIPLFVIVTILVLPEFLDILKPFRMKEFGVTLLTVTVMMGCICAYKTADCYGPLSRSSFPSDEMIEKIKDIPDGTRVFTPYNEGGYLVYNHVNVFIDGRADIYSHYTLDDYVKMTNLKNRPEEIIEKYDFEYMLVSGGTKLDYWLEIQSFYDTEVVYTDGTFYLYRISKVE